MLHQACLEAGGAVLKLQPHRRILHREVLKAGIPIHHPDAIPVAGSFGGRIRCEHDWRTARSNGIERSPINNDFHPARIGAGASAVAPRMTADQCSGHDRQRCPCFHSDVARQVHRATPSRAVGELPSRCIVGWRWGKCRRKKVRRSCAKGPRTERIPIHAEIVRARNTDGLLDGLGETSRLVGASEPRGAWPVKLKFEVFACGNGQIQIQHAGVGELDLEPINIHGRRNTRLRGCPRRQ